MPSDLTVETERKWLDLSLAQQAVWLDAKLSGSTAYQLGSWARIGGLPDEAAVKQAISLIMARHDGLRLRVDDELPRQWLDSSVEPPLTIIDLPANTPDPDAFFQAHIEDRFAGAMPLGDHPLFSVELIRAGSNLSYMLWRFHHLLADISSTAITISHWFAAYEALTSGTAQELAAPSSYLKTISSDAAYLESAGYHKDLAYWTNRFDPLPPALIADLEARPTPDKQVPTADWKFEGDEFNKFQNAAKAAGTTVQRALFALFSLTLGRRYGQSDIVSGVALHRRDLANLHTIGMLAGVILVRCQFDSFWTLEECVQAYSEQLDRDLRHQRLPVDILSRALGLAGTGRAGLFEAAMSYMPASRGWNSATVEGLPVITGGVSTKEASPISFRARELESGQGLDITFAVNADYLDAAEAQSLADLLKTACQRFVHEPDTRFEDLPTLTPIERDLTIDKWTETDANFETGTLDSLFTAQARRTPDAIAIIGRDGQSVSYADLDEHSTRLARTLAAHGVKPERVVGVRMERSTETIVALLAILKAGGVYLPLDPAYPKDRLEYISYDASALLVLESIHDLTGDADLPNDLADPRRLAYIIYTSGTTGLPKGVEVPHSAPVNLAFARRACHDPLGVGDRVLAGISVGFDVSIGQLLLPLLSGAAVVISGDLKSMGADEFWTLLAKQRVTHINSVPSFLDSILDAAPVPGTLALKRLMLGGEALSGALVSRIQHTLPGVEVVNMYGPTEACIDATFHVATVADLKAPVLPIGRPLSNYRAYVLNEILEPVGIGVTGELYLGGAGLARGYVNAADLTSERFVADPFSQSGERLYRTGDRARWRADGAIEFLGRVDQQVKIRGFRVEPGEIAATLLDHPAIAQAVVVPRAPQPGVPVRLIAYVVPRDRDALPDTSDLRTFLGKRLPDYMVPTAFVSISAIPLSRNGKLDEKALPSPDLREGEFIAPRTPAEENVAHLFAEVLGLEQCGATDHFFELGGHSLLATTLVSKLRAAGIKLPLRAVFEAPTVELLARRIDTSLPSSGGGESIAVQVRPADIPLSFPQERIWFVDRLQQDSSYNIPIAFELRGTLDIRAAEKAMEQIVARHESLRTRISLRNERPVQEIMAPAPLTFTQVDLSKLAQHGRDAALKEALNQASKHRFDLADEAPFQLRLFVLESNRHVLSAVIHHVAFDGWSAGIFLGEFAALYEAFSQQRPDPLPAPVIQYADFALWQREQNWDADLAYWLEELQGAPSHLELPTRSLAGGDSARIASTLPLTLDAPLHSALLKVAHDNGASLFMVLHAAFALLLSRWSGQDDVVIGTVMANRNRGELEAIIGCFVNTLALRTKFQAGESFTDLLGRVKSSDLASYAHQDLPFEHLVQALHPERSLQQTPIFQVMLVLQNAPVPLATLSDLSLQPVVVDAEVAKFDLTLNLAEDNGALTGSIEYANNRFDPETMAKLAQQFRRLLTTIAAQPDIDSAAIDLLDATERSSILGDWSGSETPFPESTLDRLFSEQAKRTPEAIAVIGVDGKELTYAELDALSTQMARYLVGQGICAEKVVGVRMERSADTVVAFLAILKAGGVYLPLDPAYPSDRLDYIAQNADAALVLTSIDGLCGDADIPSLSDPDRLAYIIYTSGTTGQPKGVAVPHSAPVNLAFARLACHDPIRVGDRILAAISVGFDVSIGQLLLPLLSGATVVIADDLKKMGATDFWSFLAKRGITHINSVPSFLDSILDGAPAPETLALKRLMLGGEVLSGALVSRIQKTLPGVEVVNMYGPTEACIDATFHIAGRADLSAPVLPIGRPLSNYRTYLLDQNLKPTGVGVTGELFIGGASLARGYVGSPELTAERFIQNPFSTGRLYRTGDRARWRADGEIEFLGRVDEQVKIRGFRVEPGEVETQLRRLSELREAAVVAQSTPNGNRLIAYFTSDTAVQLEGLRAMMAAALPDYMVPSAFVKLDKLPLSANGKLDRKALPDPDQSDFVTRAFETPEGEVEVQIAAIWAGLLKRERVGRHDNFFELGGHSLMAVTLIERMKQQGLSVDVRALFLTPTIAGLAGSLSSGTPQTAVPPNLITPDCDRITPEMLPLVKLTQPQIDRLVTAMPGGPANIQDIYPLSPLQEGILFQHRIATKGDPYLTPFQLAFDSRPRLDNFLTALNQVVARHDVLRTAMQWEKLDQPVQVVLRNATVEIDEVERFDPAFYQLDLTKAPLMRGLVSYDKTQRRWLMLLLTHHLILDHTSMEILVHELRALMADPGTSLPPSLPYRNFIAEARSGTSTEEQQAFFSRMLSDIEEPTAPFGLTDVQSDGVESGQSRLQIEGPLARRIREQARALGVTPASLFHTAWAAVLGQVASKTSVVFGTVLFGRMRSGAGADRVVGMFINTLPIRLDIDRTGVAASVIRTHRTLAELMQHEHAPLALAQRASAVPPPAPVFSSLFNYRYSPEDQGDSEWPGVEMVDASEHTNYPLAMAVDDIGSKFLLTALANSTVDRERVCRYLQQTLTSLVDLLEQDPNVAIETLQVLPRTERHLVVEEWNRKEGKFPQGTLDGLFAAQAARTPNALAVVGRDGKELTYTELDARSTKLARQLSAKGVRPEHVVGVRMERSAETIIALLAILKAGGVYLPLDPAYPADRLEYIARDAGALIVLDSLEGLDGEAELPPLTDPNRLAYIIYTSGTTGRPKGVAVAHSAPVNLAFARCACHDPIGPGDRILAAISVGFDVSIGQLLLPLLSGAAVIVADDLKTLGTTGFWAFLAERRVTHINSVPSFFDSVLDSAPSAETLALKRLMLGGEALSGALVGRIQRALPDVEVVNMYGPTEACIDATFHVATAEDLRAAVLPIGRPLTNYRAYVLDNRMEPVGIGVQGELYLGGAGLARGYVNAPELTAEQFVGDPFSAEAGEKLYRTGDLARWRADGAIEFLGRVDSQVKIRGFRVEPGEIETQLRKQPGVRDAAVILYAGRLVAYYTGDESTESEVLRQGMSAELPDYMVPSAFMKLDQLPLTANGKLDRKALPNPDAAAFTTRVFEPPVGEVETQMATLWAELLKVDRVGRHDNFFELGGHSLLAMTLIERMQQEGLACDVRALFGTPTIAGLAATSSGSRRIDAPENLIAPGTQRITPEMLPLVQLSQPQIDKIVATMPGGVANVQDIYPLTPLQGGLLFQHLLAKQGDPYLLPFLTAFDTRERLNSFAAALQTMAERHDVLRSAMVWEGVGNPLQVVLKQVSVPLEEATVANADELLKRFDPSTARLDLSKAPLLRAVAAEDKANKRWLLLMLTHHMILDHTSLAIMNGELRALMADPQAALPVSVPYRNFVTQAIRGTSIEEQETFFKQLLGDVDEPTAPFGLLDTQVDTSKITESDLPLDAKLAQRVREAARAAGVTPASFFHLAWAATLGFVSGKQDVVFGTTLLGRMNSGAGADRSVGMFINTLPIRYALDKTSARQSLVSSQKLLGELMAHEHTDLSLAQRCSALSAPTPLFSALLNYRYTPQENDETPWPGVEMVHSSGRTNYPISMAVDDSGTGFTLRALAHQTAGAERVNRYLQQAVVGLVSLLETAPDTPIEDLAVIPNDERQLILDQWCANDASFEQGTLDALFEAQAKRTPEAVAVVGKDGTALTYADVDAQSTRLARQLVANGVKTESVVGVRLERSSEIIIALLAVLKAGGVYLPLDPAYPQDRLDYIVKDANAILVLDSLHSLSGEADLLRLTDSNRLAYIIYTSGTTGRPKGVAVPHCAAVNLLFARNACYDPLGPGDRVLAVTSVSFDVSVGQLLFPLLKGATTVIAGDVKTMGGEAFWSLIVGQKISHVNFVPSFVELILDAAPKTVPEHLKLLILGAEALSGALVGRIQRALPGLKIVNIYGPTETTIDATYYFATPEDAQLAILPIGRPLSNYRTYILDSRMRPVSAGIEGELFIGGASLARGYVNAPELTAQRFVKDPFVSEPEARMYRTGDRVRWRQDGAIEFKGRIDQQVKIRGFRIEPGEIAAQLRHQPGVREAAVVAQREASGTRLIAYFCGDDEIETEALRNAMAAELPDYMVPAAFVRLDKLPLTLNGKLDVKALPNPDVAAFARRAFEPPVGEVETQMAALWAQLLKVDRVGRYDNFFELGGHSLLAMSLIERMQQQGLACDVRALFSSPTIAGLAAASASASAQIEAPENLITPDTERITPEMLPLVRLSQSQIDKIVATMPGGVANVQDIYPLTPLQGGLLFQHLLAKQGDPYLLPFLTAFDTRERLDSFAAALQAMAKRHDVLRSAMVWQGVDDPLQVVLRQVSVPLEEVTADNAEELLKRFDPSTARLDLSKAPLLRAIAAEDKTNNRWLLLMLTHHMILDHTSMGIMNGELRALMTDPQITLPVSVPYRNFVTQAIHGTAAEEHEAFFKRLLGGVEEPTAPFGLLDTQVNTSEITENNLPLDSQLAQRVREAARTAGVTPASFFHLAWGAALGFMSGKQDVVFGTTLLGRMQSGAGADHSVGMFINTLPIRFTLDKTSVRQSLINSQELLGELMAHEHASLSLAQKCSSLDAPAPLFSALLNYRYTPQENDETPWPGVEMLYSSGRTNFPVSMAVDDSGTGFTLRALAHQTAGAERVNRYLQQAVVGLVSLLETAPDTPIEDLAVIPNDERQLILDQWCANDASFEQGTLDALFEAQAKRTPKAVAVVGKDGTALTYADVDAQSTRLARQLVANGVKTESVVGVRLERSSEIIIALLAVLKAGGVYLPLDPAYPQDRLDYIVKDANAILVLDSLHSLSGEADLLRLTDSNRLAYIIYTSGTTGRPKGVAVPHCAAVNLLFARNACYDPLGPGDRVLAVTSVSFDVSVGQLLFPLLKGATTVIAGDVKTMGGEAFWSLIVGQKISHVNFVPSFVELILDAAPKAVPEHLKLLILGAEALSGALVGRIQRALPGLKIVNIYGPTETTIDATYYFATPEDAQLAILPIGRPLSNYRTYILDSRMRPVSAGIEGELFIGGASLARGYVNAPELTAQRFVKDPFVSEPEARMYRTGDRVRWRQDGAIEFKGRIDQQVKIRGFRIEPGEIAAQLRHQPGVREAAVVAQREASGTRLIAYFCGDDEIGTEALRNAMAAELPDYMVPAAFVRLDKLPLTLNGKLDVKALPKATAERSKTVAYEAPRSITETALQQIWQTQLSVERVGIHDNLFELGGHSLVAMRLMNACNMHFATSLPIHTLFQCPTIALLGAAIDSKPMQAEERGGGRFGHLLPMQAKGTKNKLFCIHPAGGTPYCYLPLVQALGQDQPLYAMQASGLEAGETLPDSIEQAAADYITSIREEQPEGPYQLLGMSNGGLIALEMARQLNASGNEVGLLALLDTTLPETGEPNERPSDWLFKTMATELFCGDLLELPEPPQNLAELVEMATKLGRLPAGFTVGQAERIAAVFQNSVRIHEKYMVLPSELGRSTLFLRALRRHREDEEPSDWTPYLAGLREAGVNCKHSDMLTSAMVSQTAALLVPYLK